MSMTPAAELAAARTRWPLWSIRPVGPGKGTGFTARRHGAGGLDDLWAPSLVALEDQLREIPESRAAPVRLTRAPGESH